VASRQRHVRLATSDPCRRGCSGEARTARSGSPARLPRPRTCRVAFALSSVRECPRGTAESACTESRRRARRGAGTVGRPAGLAAPALEAPGPETKRPERRARAARGSRFRSASAGSITTRATATAGAGARPPGGQLLPGPGRRALDHRRVSRRPGDCRSDPRPGGRRRKALRAPKGTGQVGCRSGPLVRVPVLSSRADCPGRPPCVKGASRRFAMAYGHP